MGETNNLLLIVWSSLATSAQRWLKAIGVLHYSAQTTGDKLAFVFLFYSAIILTLIIIHREIIVGLKSTSIKYAYILVYPLVIFMVTITGLL